MHLTILIFALGLGLVLVACATAADQSAESPAKGADSKAKSAVAPTTEPSAADKVVHSDSDWCSLLTPEQYAILRGHGTETPFQNLLWNNHEKGTYRCAGCDLLLFNSETKFDSGTGWPSFYEAVSGANVKLVADHSFGMERIEVLCPRCGGHLGHLFDDGPAPTGKRFCINSGALTFVPAAATTEPAKK